MKKLPELVVTKDGVLFADQAEGIRQFKEACCAPTRLVARPIDEYHGDMGDVLWWVFGPDGNPFEAPYCGSPNDLGYTVEAEMTYRRYGKGDITKLVSEEVGGWPGYHTHFTTFEVPVKPPSMTLGKLITDIVFAYADRTLDGSLHAPHNGFWAIHCWIARGAGGFKL